MTTATKTTWLTEYLSVWADATGTVIAALPAARAAKTFKALETAFGRDDVLARWRTAWSMTPDEQKKFLTPESFARRYGEFAPPELDAFGFVVESAEQRDLASKMVAALYGDLDAITSLADKFCVPLTFPRNAIMLRAYEAIRGSHERSVRQYAAIASHSDPVIAANRLRLTKALS